ncbi:MAG: M20/M25/M40 family metallo-hydrolase [Halobacteria archaeon]|nr:M20/M25/M40 family metallo-hydrolase [Halobacteria archaeon]
MVSDVNPVRLLEDAVRIESHESVGRMRDFLLENIDEAEPHDSGCVVARKGRENEGRHVILNTHMDVVPPHIEFKREDEIIKGRGACDAKASLVAMSIAFSRVTPKSGKVTLVISPDEETVSQGLYEYVSAELDPLDYDDHKNNMAIVGEPTGLDLCTAARGRFELVVEFEGVASHAARPESGRNAISCAAEAIKRLASLEPMEDALLGESTLTVTKIDGGEASNQVPERACFTVDRRSVPPETQEDFLKKVEDELEDIGCNVNVVFADRPTPFLEAFRTDPDEYVVSELLRTVEEVRGSEPDIRPFDAATEASYLAQYMPVVVFGPGLISDGDKPIAHSEREFVRVEEFRDATEILTRFLERTV